MDEKIKHINPNDLSPDKDIREAITFMLNTIENQASIIERHSLHTMSPKGTKVRDAFLSIVQTAAKLNINLADYLKSL